MDGKKQNGAVENWTLIMYTPFFDTPFLFFEVFFFFCLLTVFTIRVTAMRVKEADIQEKWPRVTQRSLEKFTSQVFHVCYVTAALQQIAVQFGVGKLKWINLKRE